MDWSEYDNYNSQILNWLGAKPVLYNVIFSQISGSTNAALFLDQLLYWWGKGKKRDWIYKKAKEMQAETGLTTTQQATAIKKWKKLGVLVTKNVGIPQTRHFQINEKVLIALLRKHTGVQTTSPFDPYEHPVQPKVDLNQFIESTNPFLLN